MGKKRRDGRAAKSGNSASPNAVARNSGGGGLQRTSTGIRYGDDIYKGELKDGKPHGEGRLDWDHGGMYEGEWKEGWYHGRGTMKWEDGDVYVGEWKNNFEHGKGTYRWEDGRIYEGEFAGGQMHGLGTKTWPSGKMYEGQWAEGNPHGEGTETLPTGEIYEGIWVKGEFVQRELRSQRSQQRRAENNAATKTCENCGVGDYQYKLQVCTGCNLALYCSEACQKAASRSHRRICDIVSMLPSRDADGLILKYDRDKMADLDAGLRYGTKHMSEMKHLQINLKAMSKDDAIKLSAKQLSSLLKSKKGALDSVSLVTLGNSIIPGVTENGYEVWKELHGLKQLYLCFSRFDDVHNVCDIIRQQQDTLEMLSLLFLGIPWQNAKCRRALAPAVNSCKNLVKLELEGCVLMDADLKIVLNDLPSLRILNLIRDRQDRHEFTDNTCGLIARKCPGLQELFLQNHDHLSVRGIRKIFEGCIHLRSFCTSSLKLNGKDVRGLLDVAPQLVYLALVGSDLSAAELDEVIEASGGRTVFSFCSGDGAYGPGNVSARTRKMYDRQQDVLRSIWSRRFDPEVANEWASMLH